MAKFGNNMWGTGEFNPTNFAMNGTYKNAMRGANTASNQNISDSFIGAPLAISANSPPAGPMEESLRGMPAGFEALPAMGKVGQIAGSVIVGLGVGEMFGGSLLVSSISGAGMFFLMDQAIQGWHK